MTFGCGKIDQSATSEQEDPTAVGHEEFLVVLSDGSNRGCLRLEVRDVDLAVVMARVADDGTVLHGLKVATHDDVLHAGGRAEDVAQFGRFVHGHDSVAFHHRSESRKRVNFGDDDVGAHASGAHGNTAAAVTKSSHNEGLARKENAGGA